MLFRGVRQIMKKKTAAKIEIEKNLHYANSADTDKTAHISHLIWIYSLLRHFVRSVVLNG